MSDRPLKVYVSGPISKLSEEEYQRNFAEGCEYVQAEGYLAFNPLSVMPECNESCESGLTFGSGAYQHSWQCYMRYDLIEMLKCDAIFVLPIPESDASSGVALELMLAEKVGMRVLEIDDSGSLV